MDDVAVIIGRIGAQSPQEKEAWRKVVEGITTIVFCQLKRRIATHASYYGPLSDDDLKARIKDNMPDWMLRVTQEVTKIRESLDYPRV